MTAPMVGTRYLTVDSMVQTTGSTIIIMIKHYQNQFS